MNKRLSTFNSSFRLMLGLTLLAFIFACPKPPPKPDDETVETISTSTELGKAYKQERGRKEHKDENLVALMGKVEADAANPLADDALLLIARARMDDGERGRAKIVVLRILSDYPNSNSINPSKELLGKILFDEKKYNESAELLESLPEKNKSKNHVAILLAAAYLNAGRPVEAIDMYFKIRDEIQEDSRPAKDKTIREAIHSLDIKDLKKVAKRYKGSFAEAEALASLAQKALVEGDAAEAQKYAKELLEKYPGDRAADKAREVVKAVESLMRVDSRAIGVLLPLSGSRSAAGQKALQGAMLAMDIFRPRPSADMKPFRLIIRDSKADPEVAAKMAEELIIKEKVVAIIGPLYSRPAFAAAKVADEFNVPMIALSPTDNITGVGGTIFRNCITQKDQADTLAWYITKGLGKRNIAIMYPKNAFGKSYNKYFTDELIKQGGNIVMAIPYDPVQTDFKNEIIEIARVKRKIDAIFIPDGYRNVALIAPQLRFHNILRMQLLGTREWNNPKLIQNITPKDVEGAIFVDGFWAESYDPSVAVFVDDYTQVFGIRPGIIEAQAFEAVKVLVYVSKMDDVVEREDLLAGLMSLKHFNGIHGQISMSGDRSFKKSLFLLTIKDGKVLEIGP